MTTLAYPSGEAIQAGDQIRYHGEQGHVEFVVIEPTGEAALDWYLGQFPGGGAMIVAQRFGNVFLGVGELDDFLEFVARCKQ